MINPSEISKKAKEMKISLKNQINEMNESPAPNDIKEKTEELLSLLIEKIDETEEIAWRNSCIKNPFLFKKRMDEIENGVINTMSNFEKTVETSAMMNKSIVDGFYRRVK